MCGSVSEKGAVQQLAKGVFFTLVNVHNPSPHRVTFSWKVVIETRVGVIKDPPLISSFRSASADPNSALKIDAADLFAVVTGGGPVIVGGSVFIMGFAVIVSPVELDVAAVYTARLQKGDVSSIDVETIQPRVVSTRQGLAPRRRRR